MPSHGVANKRAEPDRQSASDLYTPLPGGGLVRTFGGNRFRAQMADTVCMPDVLTL
jgi:hypothetical protein